MAALDKSLFDTQPEASLVRLPTEVLQEVFLRLDVHSFFIALQTCKRFWLVGSGESALRVLRRQINRIPGTRRGLTDVDARNLFSEFRRRATDAAVGASVLSDTRTTPLPQGSLTSKCAISSLYAVDPLGQPCSITCLALANHHNFISVIQLSKTGCDLVVTISPQEFLEPNHSAAFISVAFGPPPRGDLIVIFRLHCSSIASCTHDHDEMRQFYLLAKYSRLADAFDPGHNSFCCTLSNVHQFESDQNTIIVTAAISSEQELCIARMSRQDKIGFCFTELNNSREPGMSPIL